MKDIKKEILETIDQTNNIVLNEVKEFEIGFLVKFTATLSAGYSFSYTLQEDYDIRVLKWKRSKEYYFLIKKIV